MGLAENVNSAIEEMYPGITCGLTQTRGILGAWGGGGVYYRGLSCENYKLCEWATSYSLFHPIYPFFRFFSM